MTHGTLCHRGQIRNFCQSLYKAIAVAIRESFKQALRHLDFSRQPRESRYVYISIYVYI